MAKRLSAEVPVASSPITTRWRQSQAGDVTALSFGEEHSTADLPETVLKMTPEKETLTPGEVIEMPQASFEILKKDILLRESVLQKYLVLYLVNYFFLLLNKKFPREQGKGRAETKPKESMLCFKYDIRHNEAP